MPCFPPSTRLSRQNTRSFMLTLHVAHQVLSDPSCCAPGPDPPLCPGDFTWLVIVDDGNTEGGHCQGACRPQWFFYVPLQVSETAPPFYVVMRATRDTQSPMLKSENFFSESLPRRAARLAGECANHCATAPLGPLKRHV